MVMWWEYGDKNLWGKCLWGKCKTLDSKYFDISGSYGAGKMSP